jgi:hypothetical protein
VGGGFARLCASSPPFLTFEVERVRKERREQNRKLFRKSGEKKKTRKDNNIDLDVVACHDRRINIAKAKQKEAKGKSIECESSNIPIIA